MPNQQDIWNSLYKSNLQWKKETLSIPSILKGKVVLELGVGNGKTLISILKQKPKKVFAIDFSEKAIEICKKQFKNPNLILKHADFLKLPIEPRSFDIIVCYYFLNNLNEKDMHKAISKIYTILKPSGLLLFEDFAQGDFRQKQKAKTKPFCHFFKEKEVKSLFSKFKITNLNVKSTNPIKSDKKITRKIISAIIKKAN